MAKKSSKYKYSDGAEVIGGKATMMVVVHKWLQLLEGECEK